MRKYSARKLVIRFKKWRNRRRRNIANSSRHMWQRYRRRR